MTDKLVDLNVGYIHLKIKVLILYLKNNHELHQS